MCVWVGPNEPRKQNEEELLAIVRSASSLSSSATQRHHRRTVCVDHIPHFIFIFHLVTNMDANERQQRKTRWRFSFETYSTSDQCVHDAKFRPWRIFNPSFGFARIFIFFNFNFFSRWWTTTYILIVAVNLFTFLLQVILATAVVALSLSLVCSVCEWVCFSEKLIEYDYIELWDVVAVYSIPDLPSSSPFLSRSYAHCRRTLKRRANILRWMKLNSK